MKIIKNKTCRMCNSTKFSEVINIGKHPLVNSLIKKDQLKFKDPAFPIVVKQCKNCKLVQMTEIIDANEIYKNVDYLYFSSDMPGLDKYFKAYAEEVKSRFLKSKKELVVEIGCNDGVMLQFFSKFKILGVDPSTNVILRTLKKDIPSIPLFFTHDIAKKICREWGPAKVIIGNNCIAHLNDLKDLMKGVHTLLRNDGVFIVECNYWGGMVKNTNYSLIYHDHFSYFSVQPWVKFLKQYNMKVFDAVVTPAQGGSLRMYISKDKRKSTLRLNKIIDDEIKYKLNTFERSKFYRNNVFNFANKLKKIVYQLVKEGKTIAGYGAAAKGMTILKCSNINNKHIKYFVDDSPAKQGWYSPIDHIPIISRKDAEKKLPDYFIILAPNYSDVILKKEKEFIRNGGRFIIPKNNITII
jgi:SAM-dependent methyltransferase